MGATLGGAFGLLVNAIVPVPDFGVTTCAIIGMATMVGGGTGAAMTAVTMIFEMTRDYDLVMPSIIAVALAIGIRRLISQENIYTIKLVGRGHFVPKALHANMLLVHRAREIMEKNVTILPADADFDAFLRHNANERGFRHVVVIRSRRGRSGQHNAAARRRAGLQRRASRRRRAANFTIAREDDIMFDLVQRMARHHAAMAVVVKGQGRGRPSEIIGVISKEHIADSVADSIKPFG